jgi:hypothetical protein
VNHRHMAAVVGTIVVKTPLEVLAAAVVVAQMPQVDGNGRMDVDVDAAAIEVEELHRSSIGEDLHRSSTGEDHPRAETSTTTVAMDQGVVRGVHQDTLEIGGDVAEVDPRAPCPAEARVLAQVGAKAVPIRGHVRGHRCKKTAKMDHGAEAEANMVAERIRNGAQANMPAETGRIVEAKSLIRKEAQRMVWAERGPAVGVTVLVAERGSIEVPIKTEIDTVTITIHADLSLTLLILIQVPLLHLRPAKMRKTTLTGRTLHFQKINVRYLYLSWS